MRAPKNEAAGTAGQSYVKAEFEELGWGANSNLEHDLGTDLWLMARDERRYELGALVGVQVKNGRSFFDGDEARDDDGNLLGWWYAEADDSHFDYWSDHTLPHLLVLRDPRSKLSHWVHIKKNAIVSTGKGNKILVPSHQLIDEDHRQALTAVATSPKKAGSWDGSAWNIDQTVAVNDSLRYAMMTPRLVAPHPNAGVREPSAVQALASLVQLRMRDIDNVNSFAKRSDAGLDDLASWTWRLFDAMYTFILTDETSELSVVASEATQDYERAAVAVMQSCAQIEKGNARQALEVLRTVHEGEDFDTVNHAWLSAHEARCLGELGKSQEARDVALSVQNLSATSPGDPTAMAIVAATGSLIFNLSDWGQGSLASVIQASDTAARWWRSQTVMTGLNQHFDEGFNSWAGDKSVTIGSTDVTWTSLRSASLLAAFSADHGGWQHAGSLLARRVLMVADGNDTQNIEGALDLLRLVGDDSELSLVTKKFIAQGPIAPLTGLAARVDLAETSRSNLKSSLSLIRFAGDVLTTSDADRHAEWALKTLSEVDVLVSSLRLTFLLAPAVLEMLSGVMLAVSPAVKREVMDYMVAMPPVIDQYGARSYVPVINRVLEEEWTVRDVESLKARSGDNFELADEIDRILAVRVPGYRTELLSKIAGGDLRGFCRRLLGAT